MQALKRASVRVAGCVEFWVLISSLVYQLASEPSRFAPSQRSWVDKIRVQQSFFAEGKFCRKFQNDHRPQRAIPLRFANSRRQFIGSVGGLSPTEFVGVPVSTV